MVDANTHNEALRPHGLRALFHGENAWCADSMMLSSELTDGMPVLEFLHGAQLTKTLHKCAATYPDADLRAVSSFWSLYYFSLLVIPYICARQNGVALPVELENMTIAINDQGLPRSFGLLNGGQACDALDVMDVISQVAKSHLNTVVQVLKDRTGISPRLAWNNAAVYIDYAINSAAEHHSYDGWPCRPLFETQTFADGTRNPFFDCLRRDTDHGANLCRRKICCLRYKLPGVAGCGELCALPELRKQ
ncbi:siderophore-iron reductase FhuF [Ochrobactrum vermis]|uniref:Siderophore-iron reductase FhuF n=1 Tax=Ochrobactrum vermis TaxID=1827297 RepID=A0ABU8PG71_9HYPH|nr:siderophore-iron reductase FhuF [Ochrobactrum vermis]PQZ25643.1 siderophore-iron reductase FhuF [Ochrobactrum vermis]